MAVDSGPYDPRTVDAIGKLPQVEQSRVYVATAVAVLVHGRPDFSHNTESLASLDGRFFDQDRFTATHGRRPDPGRVDEVAVNEIAAAQYGYRVGQKLVLGTYDPRKATQANPGSPVLRMTATIVGAGLFPNEVLQDDTDRSPLMLLTPAYTKQALPYAQYNWQGLVLKHGDAQVTSVKQAYVSHLAAGFPQFFHVTSLTTFHIEQAIRPLSIALALFGAIAGLACLALVGQAIGRQLRSEREEREVLRALGATPAAGTRAAALGPTLVVFTGTAFAVVVAIIGSPLMPIGKVRRVETARGFDADWTVLGFGALALCVGLGAVVWVTAWRAVPHHASERSSGLRPSKVAAVAQGAGLSAAGVAGLRVALERGRGRAAMPVRSVMAGVAIAMVGLVAAATFGSSLTRLVDTPRLYGWAWDATLLDQSGYGQARPDHAQAVFAKDTNVDAWTGAYFGADTLNHTNVALLGVTPGASVHPPILHGRPVESSNEIVLGSRTLAQLHLHIADTVTIGSRSTHVLRIVGTGTLPTLGVAHGAYPSLGVGAMVDYHLIPGYNRNIARGGYVGPNVLFVKFRDGINTSAAVTTLRREMNPIADQPGNLDLIHAQRPAEIVNTHDVGSAPTVLAGALAIAALTSLALALGASVRRRRRDLALLKTLGFTGRQVGATVRWQAGATILAGLLVGIPLGIVAGRVSWTMFANQLDVVPQPSTPIVTILAISTAAIIVALTAAAIPAHTARRVRPATLLNAE